MILSNEQVNDLASPLVEILEKFYEDEKNVKEFRDWLENRRNDERANRDDNMRHWGYGSGQ